MDSVNIEAILKYSSKFLRRENIENLPRSGRPRKTDERGDRKILSYVKTCRRQPHDESLTICQLKYDGKVTQM